MKALAILVSVVAVGSLLFWMTKDGEAGVEPAQAPPPVAEEEVVVEPAQMALPPELEEEELEAEEIVSEEIPNWRDLDIDPKEVTKPRLLGRRMLPDGRVEARILSPIYYGNGEKKVVVRVLRASPRQMKRDTIQMRVPERNRGKKGNGGGDVPGAGGGKLNKKGK